MDERKRCTTCGQSRLRSEFNRSTRRKDGLQTRCRPCDRAWYVRNAEEHKRKVRLRNDRVREEWKQRISAYLVRHPCVDCGADDLRVLEFDHTDPRTKTGTIGRLVASSMAWERIEAEFAKCLVRCSNCHRVRTMADCGSWRTAAQQQVEEERRDAARQRLAALLPPLSG